MNKYISINAVIPFIPNYVMEEDNESTILKYIWQGVRQNLIPYYKYDEKKLFVCQIEDYEAIMPKDIYKISFVHYVKSLPESIEDADVKPWILEIIANEKVLIAQSLVFSEVFSDTMFQPMRYTGQNTNLFESDCINVFCNDCTINFSLTKSLEKLRCDIKEGFAVGIYHASPKNDLGEFLIPDNAHLLQALAFFAEAKHWQERSGRKEEASENMFISRLDMANKKFAEFNKQQLYKNFDADNYVFSTQSIKQLPQQRAQFDRINTKKTW